MRYSPYPNVVARELDGAVVLVNLDTSRIFTLNATGSHIWQLLSGPAGPQDLEMLKRRLSEEYEVDRDQLHAEVLDLLRQLQDERLVIGTTVTDPD